MLRKLTIIAACLINSCLADAPRTIDAGTLATNYGTSRDATRRDLEGKELVVTGYVVKHPERPGDGESEGHILIGDEINSARPPVQCWFSRKAAAEFGDVVEDQPIKVKGVFSGETGAVLRFCSEVK